MLTNPQAEAIRRAVVGALRSAIKDDGPITAANVGSAAKRVLGKLANAGDPRDRRSAVKRRYRLGSASPTDL